MAILSSLRSTVILQYPPNSFLQHDINKTLSLLVFDIQSLNANSAPVASPVGTLTDAATVAWDFSTGDTKTVTLTASRALAITNPVAGTYGAIKVIQGGTGSYALTLPAGSKVVNGGAGAVALSTAVGSIDILTFFYDGTNYFWNAGLNYN